MKKLKYVKLFENFFQPDVNYGNLIDTQTLENGGSDIPTTGEMNAVMEDIYNYYKFVLKGEDEILNKQQFEENWKKMKHQVSSQMNQNSPPSFDRSNDIYGGVYAFSDCLVKIILELAKKRHYEAAKVTREYGMKAVEYKRTIGDKRIKGSSVLKVINGFEKLLSDGYNKQTEANRSYVGWSDIELYPEFLVKSTGAPL